MRMETKMSRPTQVAEAVTLVVNIVGAPTINFVPDTSNPLAGGNMVLGIGDRAFEDDSEYEQWLAVFLWKNQKAYDRNTISAAAFILTSMAREAFRTQ
jgi:hypothetical protein